VYTKLSKGVEKLFSQEICHYVMLMIKDEF